MNIVAKGNNIEKIFHLEPFSNPKQINLKLNGVEDICENENGELQLEINGNTIAFTTPIAWQIINGNKIDIPVSYNIKENFVYGFNLGDYNPQFPLYIDPLLSSTFIGGSQMDIVNKIAISSTGKVYAGGITSSPDFPFTPGSFDETFNEAQDIFIAVFDSSLSTLEACTFVGGQGQDILTDMKLDDNDNVYFSGYTTSQDYPVTSLAYDTTFNNPGKPFTDIVISCLDSKLKEMKYSTFMGSELGDKAVAFDFDGSFNLIVTGISGGGIPIVGPQFFPDAKEFIIFKMDSQLKNLLATNSIQTDSLTIPVDLVAESSQSVFITGYTEDPNFPVTPNAFMDTLTGYSDVFVINLSNDLSVLNNSTFLGGKKYEAPTDIILDKDNNVLLAGNTKSKSFPVTTNAYDTIFANPDAGLDDIFICMLDFTLSEIKYSSFLGGNNQEILGQLAIDDTGNIFLSGSTNSKDFPMFCNSIDDVFNGTSDGFVVKFSPKLENLIGASFIGGDEDDYCLGLARDHAGNIYTAGFTTSIDFPVYNGFDNFYNGDSGDGFIMKMSADLQKPYPCCTQIFDPVPESIDNPRILNLKWEQSIGATGYLLSIGTTKDSFNLLYKYDLANQTSYIWDFDCGDDTVYVKISPYNDFGVNETCDTIWFVIRQPFENTEYISICEGDSVEWQGSYYSESGVYTESYMDIEGCDSTYTLNLNVYPNYYYGEDAEICNGDSYFWQGDFYTTAGDYYKNYNTINGCDSIFELQLTVLPSYLFEFDTTICQGDTVFWQNYSLTSGGFYTSEYQTIDGCDSIYQLNLTVLPSYYFEEEAGICEGDTFYWQGMTLDSAGTYFVQYSTVENCDSNYLLNLSVFPSYSFEEAAEICSSDTFYW
ncbi:MAG TPA: hypothetical protein ENK91_01970, partial [Bacteroidetes bacterium]|nr:hypothetical protein [Bacteroidota bacterium]